MSSDLDSGPMGNDTTTTATHVGLSGEPLYEWNVVYFSFLSFFSFLIIFSNGIVVMVVAYSRDLHLPTVFNIAFMASCDLLYGLHYVIFAIPSLYTGKFAYSEKMMTPASISMTLLFGQNIFNIFLSITDRYISICWPLRYPCLMSAKRFLIAVFILIAINIIRLFLIIFPKSGIYYNKDLGFCVVNFKTLMAAAASVGVPFLTSLSIIVLLVKIWMEFRCRKRTHPTSAISVSNQFTVTMSLAALVFIVCYIPTCETIVMAAVSGKDKVSIASIQASTLIVLSNSFWNVVIYATTYRSFRNGFLKLFCRKIFRDRARHEADIGHTGTSITT